MSDPIAFARALADATRWRIIHLVFDRALCVCELADVLKLPQSTLSSHLRVIQAADLLDCERREKWLFYRVKAEFQPVLRALFRHFEATAGTVPALARDARKAETRVTQREDKCCPEPQVLATRTRKSKSKTVNI
jgi:ArsR family transcriptional regulator